jgi:tRNA (guanine-N7-)-methyltransferase
LEAAESDAGVRSVGINPRQDGTEKLDLPAIFGNAGPVIVEIGSGKGRYLLWAAAEQPEVNFLGIEKSPHYYRVIVDRVQRAGRSNIRVVNHDAAIVIGKMISDASVSEVHIYFPDPWPRPRERKRRLIKVELLREIERILGRDGRGVYVTDHREYFEKSVPIFESVFSISSGEVRADNPARTNYETKYKEEGRPIYQIEFRKRWTEAGRH